MSTIEFLVFFANFYFPMCEGVRVPGQFMDTLLRNVAVSACRGVVLSWAVPGQGGNFRANCQPGQIAAMAASPHL